MRHSTPKIGRLKISDRSVLEYREGHFTLTFDGMKLLRDPGINCAVSTLGMWTDSTQAVWRVLVSNPDLLRLEIRFTKIPMTQVWDLKAPGNDRLEWLIECEIEEWLSIDEFRCLCILNPAYQTWFSDDQTYPFARFNAGLNSFFMGETAVYSLGAKQYDGVFRLPSFTMLSEDGGSLPIVQNFPERQRARCLGFRKEFFAKNNDFIAGAYPFFQGSIYLGKEIPLVGNNKKDPATVAVNFESVSQTGEEEVSRGRKIPQRVLLANMPWQRDGAWGIRAGSRWPHVLDCSEGDYLPFPFFLAYATTLLKEHSIEATIIDAIAEQMPESQFIEMIKALKADILVAETSIPSLYDDLDLLKRISGALDIQIILCGPVSQITDESFLKDNGFITYVLCGEYEFALLELVRALQKGSPLSAVNGILYRNGDTVIKTLERPLSDVNALPWPHRETLPMHRYLDAPGEMLTPSAQILASRGCPFPCQFCLWPQVMYQGRTYRFRDVKNIIDEMEYLVCEKKYKSVYFDDDTFNIGKERMLEFCREIRLRGLEKTQWAIMARADLMDEEILEEMKLSGLWAVKYGVETAVQELADNIGKQMDLKKTERMIRYTQELGIRTHLTFTFGLPGETHETMERTTQWALDLNPFTIQFSIMTPFPGTKYYDYLKEKGQIVSHNLAAYDGHFKSVIKSDVLTPEDLEGAKKRACDLWAKHLKTRRVQNGAVDVSDILFLQCPPWDSSMPPLGIAYLANYLYHKGMKVKVYDLNAHLSRQVSDDARYLWEQRSYDCWHNDEHFKGTWEVIQDTTRACLEDVFNKCEPLCVGLSVNAAGISFAVKIIRIIKEINKNVHIIVGGWGCVNAHMRSLYPWDLVDAFVVGEGEETIKEVIDMFKGNGVREEISGVVFTALGEKHFMPRTPVKNIDQIPWPSYREFDLGIYTSPVLPIFASRGCIGHCSFCNDWPFSRPYRYRTAWHIFDELRYHVEKHNIHVFSFKDLLCNGNILQLGVLCDLIINSGMKIHWDSQAISREEMTYDLLVKMKQAGCSTLIYGIESFSDNVLKRMKKLFSAATSERVIRDTYRAGISVFFNIIVGFPGETEADLEETMNMIRRNREYITQIGAVSTCLVNGNSELDEKAEEYGIELSDDPQVRAKQWWSKDGTNTYEVRRARAEKVLALLKELNLMHATVTM